MICVFDCETIPDAELLRKKFDLQGSDEEVSKQALQRYEQSHGTTFLPHPFHKVVAVSAVLADDFGAFDRVFTSKGESEKEIIGGFLAFIDRYNPKLVTFNGRNFDIPLLMIRALKYNISCPAYFEQDNQALNKTKWDNYRSRFSETFHIDLMDVLGNYGAVRNLSLDVLCQMAGIPGKFDVSGDQVMELFYAGEQEKIREYCESDVLNTYLLYLKYELLKGNISLGDYKKILEDMAKKLPQKKSYSDIFLQFFQKETDGNH